MVSKKKLGGELIAKGHLAGRDGVMSCGDLVFLPPHKQSNIEYPASSNLGLVFALPHNRAFVLRFIKNVSFDI